MSLCLVVAILCPEIVLYYVSTGGNSILCFFAQGQATHAHRRALPFLAFVVGILCNHHWWIVSLSPSLESDHWFTLLPADGITEFFLLVRSWDVLEAQFPVAMIDIFWNTNWMGLSGFGPEGVADTHKGVQLNIGKSSGEMACGKNNERSGKTGNRKAAERFKKKSRRGQGESLVEWINGLWAGNDIWLNVLVRQKN